jgi:hypothetical protein
MRAILLALTLCSCGGPAKTCNPSGVTPPCGPGLTCSPDCGEGLTCDVDGKCGIPCGNGNTVCDPGWHCSASADCLPD